MGVQFTGGPDRVNQTDADPNYKPPPLMGFGWKPGSETGEDASEPDQSEDAT